MKLQNTDFANLKAIRCSESETWLESFLAGIAMIVLIIVCCVALFLVAPV